MRAFKNPLFFCVIVLLAAAGPAFATGQEMAGMAGAFVLIFALMAGLPLGALAVGILVVLAQRKGWWGRYPRRIVAACATTLLAGPLAAYLGVLLLVEIESIHKYPGKYTWLTGWDPRDESTWQSAGQPMDFKTVARNQWRRITQDIVIFVNRDPQREMDERAASEANHRQREMEERAATEAYHMQQQQQQQSQD